MRTFFADLKADRQAYAALGGWVSHPGFWIVAIHRLGEWVHRLPRGLRVPLWLLYRALHLSYWAFNVELWAGKGGSKLGPGLCLIHPNNVYFGPGVDIGPNCLIHHEVTLGMGSVPGTPKLGKNVVLYPGARIQGGIVLGDDVVVGANCVVSRHIAPGTVVLPAVNRLMPRSLSPTVRRMDAEHAAHPPTTES